MAGPSQGNAGRRCDHRPGGSGDGGAGSPGTKTPAGWEPDGDSIGAGTEPALFLSTAPRRRPGEMKESILDVLLYLFEHDCTEEAAPPIGDRDALSSGPLFNELTQAGFSAAEIHKAFDWLDALAEQRPGAGAPRADGPIRVYFGPELDKLDVECRGFLLFLEQQGILDAGQRELVLDRAMALDQDELDLDDLKWVVLMVLFNQPGSEAAYAWMETQMFLDEPEPVH
jgi:Smg protein